MDTTPQPLTTDALATDDILADDSNEFDYTPAESEEQCVLQSFMEDDILVPPDKRNHYALTLAHAYIKEFTVDKAPYNHASFDKKKCLLKPSLEFLKKEYKRRNPTATGYKNKPMAHLLGLFADDDQQLEAADLEYLKGFIANYEKALLSRINDPSAAAGSRITNADRLRLIEASLCDEAKEKIRATQECFTRHELDARNSSELAEDYFGAVSRMFNNNAYNPVMKVFPELHHRPFKAGECE